MSERKRISILLSTYNGAPFLSAQLDSILAQTFQDWMLVIRDDGSTDNTVEIIRQYADKGQGKIIFNSSGNGNLGVKESYSRLLSSVEQGYVAFADQDDVWDNTKLEVLMNRMADAEVRYGAQIPIVVFSDLEVVDEELNMLSPSFIRYSGLSARYAQRNTILCRNVAPGCSMMVNAALVAKAGAIPVQAVMHDYWIMLVAHYMGKIEFVPEKLVKYRQHGRNQLGARSTNTLKWRQIFRNFWWYMKGANFYLDRFVPYQEQAHALLNRFPDAHEALEPVKAFVLLQASVSRWRRKWNVLRYGLKAGNFRENIELILCA